VGLLVGLLALRLCSYSEPKQPEEPDHMQADHGDFVSRTLEEPHGVEVIFDWLGFVMSFAHHAQPPRSDALHHRVTPRSDVPHACMGMRLQKRKARPNMSQYYWRFGCPSTRVPNRSGRSGTGMEADVAAGQQVCELGRLVGGDWSAPALVTARVHAA
jgi:hypothetical protein